MHVEIVADNTLAKKVLNWSPSKNIEQMCKDGWKWESSKSRWILKIK